MKGAELPSSSAIVRPAPANGTQRSTKANGAPPKRPARAGMLEDARVTEPLAPPIISEQAVAVDAPMWPVQVVGWLQPEVAPSLPVWNGLSIERHNRIPIHDFLSSGNAPLDRPDVPDNAREMRTPAAEPSVPQSGLALLGWDPRAVCWKKEGK